MKHKLFLLLLVFTTVLLKAQSPVFQWAKLMEVGPTPLVSNDCYSYSVDVDVFGNVYSTGNFRETVDFDPGPGVYNVTEAGFQDIFISKLDPSGNFLWAKGIGGSASIDGGTSLSADGLGNVYVTGYFYGTVDFDPGAAVFNMTGSDAMFILKLDPSGNFLWAKTIDLTHGHDIEAFGSDIYITGAYGGTIDFDPGAGIFNLSSGAGMYQDFVLKLDASGNFVWAKGIQGASASAYCYSQAISLDALGNVYTAGLFSGTLDCDPGAGVYNITASTGAAYVWKLDSSGDFVWAKNFAEGATYAESRDIAVNSSGDVYVTGVFMDTADFDSGPLVTTMFSGALSDMYVLKLNASGDFIWAHNTQGTAGGLSIAVDTFGDVYATGFIIGSVDFDPGPSVSGFTAGSAQDMYILKYGESGNLIWAITMKGNWGHNYPMSIAVDQASNIYTTGYIEGQADYDPGAGIFLITADQVMYSKNIFVSKLSQSLAGIDENNGHTALSIYPNPCSGIFNVSISLSIKRGIIEVYNSLGALVYKQDIMNQQNVIELKNQAAGLYFVKVMSENKIIGIEKIIKE